MNCDFLTLSNTAVKDLTPILRLKEIRLYKSSINIKWEVEKSLDKTFYDSTAETPQDWKVYSEMRNLAVEKYNLDIREIKLPAQTHGQGKISQGGGKREGIELNIENGELEGGLLTILYMH